MMEVSVSDYTAHYAEMEKRLVSLLQKVAHLLTTEDLAEASEFLAAARTALPSNR